MELAAYITYLHRGFLNSRISGGRKYREVVEADGLAGAQVLDEAVALLHATQPCYGSNL
jgi:hypothetical protein